MDSIAETYKNIHVIHQKNSGVSVARNVGIKASHGKYVTFVDADDMVGLDVAAFDKYFDQNSRKNIGCLDTFYNPISVINPSKKYFGDKYFVNMLQVAYDTKSDVVLGGKIAMHYDDHCMIRYTYDSKIVRGSNAKDELLFEADARENANFALYSRQMLNKHNLRFLANMNLDEDMLFCMLAVLYAPKVATAPDATYFYNRHMNTLSNIPNKNIYKLKHETAQVQRFSVLLNEIAKMPQYMIKEIFGYWTPYYINAADIKGIDCNYYTCTQKDCTNCPVAKSVLTHCKKTIEKSL